jgi:hypothetical protein
VSGRSQPPQRARAGWLALAACLLAGPAWAGEPPAPAAEGETPRVAILALSLRGIPADQERRYQELLRTELKRAGYEVIDERDARKQLERLGAPPNCTVGPCLQRVGGALRAQRVLVGGVLAQGSNYDVILTFIDTSQGAPVAQAQERCEVCTSDEGLRAFGRVIGSLTGRAPSSGAAGPPPPRVVWQSSPPWYQHPATRLTALSLGIGSLAVGAALLAFDGACNGHNCQRTFEFTIPGAVLVGVGALFTTAFVLSYIIRSPTRPAPRLAVGAGPTGVLLCGRY